MQSDIFEEYEKINQQLMDVIKEIRSMCDKGQYDDAQTIVDEKYKPLEEKWRDCQQCFLSAILKKK